MPQFRNLVFEGGGVKGIAYGGAIQVLEEKAVLPEIKRVAGASAGAITAALLAAGVTGKDVERIVGGKDFSKFADDAPGFVRDTLRFLHRYGWFKGDAFSCWIKDLMGELTGNMDLNFEELGALAQEHPDRYRELFVVVTNLSRQKAHVFSQATTPRTPIWAALRMSMSIPLYFASVAAEAPQPGSDAPLANDVIVDGGVTWNYPIDIFDDSSLLTNRDAGVVPTYAKKSPSTVYNKETLGLRVDTKDEITAQKESECAPPTHIDNIFDYTGVLLGFLLEAANSTHIHQNDWHRTIFIDAMGIKTTQFSLSNDQVRTLVQSGRDGTNAYFDWFLDPASSPINRM